MSQTRYYYTYVTLPLYRLEIIVAIMLVDQINKTCRSNIGQDLDSVQSMSMVTTQPFANCKKTVEYQLTYLVFFIVSKSSNIRE